MSTPQNDQPIATWSPGPRGPARIYKNRAVGQTKKSAGSCVACFPRNCVGQRVPLAHGVSLILCEGHRDPRFIASRSGRDFIAALGALFRGIGITAERYTHALMRFARECCSPPKPGPRHRPGSYAWPARRQDAETAWSAGASFERGLQAALADPPDDLHRARLPSARSVRRWWQDRRWLAPAPAVPITL